MQLKENIVISIGAFIILIIILLLNLILNLNIILSVVIAIIVSIIISLLISKQTIRTILGIIAWGLISFAILVIILKWFGIIN